MGFLVPSTDELADSAMNKLRKGEATTVPVAVRKAIRGHGITAAADLKRRTKEVLREMQRRSTTTKNAAKHRLNLSDKISP